MDFLDAIDADMHRIQYRLLEQLASSMYDGLMEAVIDGLRNLPFNERYGYEGDLLEDVWEEFKEGMQYDVNYNFYLYEITVRDFCAWQVDELDRDRKRFLWLWSEGFLETWVGEDEVQLAHFMERHVAEELYDRICKRAGSEPLGYELEESICRECPMSWPGQDLLDLYNIEYLPDWLRSHLPDKPSRVLINLPEHEERASAALAEAYATRAQAFLESQLREMEELASDLPFPLLSDPTATLNSPECRAHLQREFLGFLREWRNDAASLLAKARQD